MNNYPPGVSFLVKIHNEETTLETSIRSLFGLLITYEIILILHRCTDASTRIALRLQAEQPTLIRILTYNATVARPGYETLVTEAASPHSLPTYYNWAHQQRRYLWTAKWDADFVATPALRTYLNTADVWHLPHQLIWLGATSSTHTEYHSYFTSCLSHYRKDIFYEAPVFRFDPSKHVRHMPPVHIQHLSSVSHLKDYWWDPPWFDQETSEEATIAKERYNRLIVEFGMPPVGMGRSGDSTTAIEFGNTIISAWPEYVSFE